MALLALLQERSRAVLARLAVMSGLAGLGNALVMAVASDAVTPGHADLRRLLLFILAILIYVVATREVVRGSARELEEVVHGLRLDLLDRIRNASVAALGRLHAAEAYAAVTRDTQAISQAATALTLASQAAFLLLFTLLYLLWLSRLEFAALAVAGVVLGAFAVRRARTDRVTLDRTVAAERALLADITGLLDGFKEAKASARRASAQLAAISDEAWRTASVKTAASARAAIGAVGVQTGVYLALTLLVFALPLIVMPEPLAQSRTVTALLFAAGSIGLLVQSIPILAAADEAAASLAALGARLPPERAGLAPLPEPPPVAIRDAIYAWRDSEGRRLFEIGPLDLQLDAGTIVFVTGGNGSGKSTLLRMICGLLPPEQGMLCCGGEPVGPESLQTYRDQIGSILADAYLFRRPYGLDADPAAIAAGLAEYGLTGKVAVSPDGSWDGRALSSGQRKRLAMLMLQLAAPRVVVLDEWAADQDPEFRRHFYQRILPDLRARNCAVLCATHDERFFSVADRWYMMRDGRLSLSRPGRAPGDVGGAG